MDQIFVAFSEYLNFTACQFRFEAKSVPSNDLLSITLQMFAGIYRDFAGISNLQGLHVYPQSL